MFRFLTKLGAILCLGQILVTMTPSLSLAMDGAPKVTVGNDSDEENTNHSQSLPIFIPGRSPAHMERTQSAPHHHQHRAILVSPGRLMAESHPLSFRDLMPLAASGFQNPILNTASDSDSESDDDTNSAVRNAGPSDGLMFELELPDEASSAPESEEQNDSDGARRLALTSGTLLCNNLNGVAPSSTALSLLNQLNRTLSVQKKNEK